MPQYDQRIRLPVACAFAIAFAAASGHAQERADNRAMAETLFQHAKRLMAEKHYGEACPKFQESQRLDPAGGTLLNLASCHELDGKLAMAWAEFKEAAAVARRDNRKDRLDVAEQHIAALEPRMSRVAIVMGSGADLPGLAIELDGVALGAASLGTPLPIDGGTHVVTASAPGHNAWHAELRFGMEADSRRVLVPVLSAIGQPPSVPVESGPNPQRITAFVLGGVGIAALGIGTYLGVRAASKRSESDDNCKPQCTQAGVDLNDQARVAAHGADLGFGIGLVGLGVATYLFLTSPNDTAARAEQTSRARPDRLRVNPYAARGHAGMWLSGEF